MRFLLVSIGIITLFITFGQAKPPQNIPDNLETNAETNWEANSLYTYPYHSLSVQAIKPRTRTQIKSFLEDKQPSTIPILFQQHREGEPPPDGVHTMFGARFLTTSGKVLLDWTVAVKLFSGQQYKLSLNSDKIYLNGELYDPNKCSVGWEPHEEFLRWYSFTGYCKLRKHDDGSYHFTSATGDELASIVKSVGGNASDLYTSFQPRLTSLQTCRQLWEAERLGQIRWNPSLRTYTAQ